MKNDIGLQLLEIQKKLRVLSPYFRKWSPVFGWGPIESNIYYQQLKEESLKLQEKIGLQNKRKIAKELGCSMKEVNKK